MKKGSILFLIILMTILPYHVWSQTENVNQQNESDMALLKAGEMAPDFTAKNQNGKEISLSSFRGKKVVLYFYPKDDTPGCTAEACNLRDNYEDLTKKGFEVIGVSPDDEKSHTKFAVKYNLQFNLIADTSKTILKQYGVWGLKKMYGKEYEGVLRTTYVIDEKGKIEKVIDKVETGNHAAQVLKELGMN